MGRRYRYKSTNSCDIKQKLLKAHIPITNISQKPPTIEEQLGNIKNQLTLIEENAKEQRASITNNILQQILIANGHITNSQAEIKRLQELCTKHKINFSPPQPKQPNRAERRAVDKRNKKKSK